MSRSRVNLRSVNLNLLPILESLLTTRSVSRTAGQLHMSQSAVSDALARLRLQFRDEILVRRGREMALTPFARELVSPLADIIRRTESLVEAPPFDPAQLEREFIVATADPVSMTIGAPLFQLFQAQAPRASVRFVDLDANDYGRLLGMDLDLVIVPRGFLRQDRLLEARIYEEVFVCIARRGHPQIRKTITRSLYSSLAHVSYRPSVRGRQGLEAQLVGLDQRDVIKVPSFSLLPMIVEQTDAIALVQLRVAERLAATADIQIYEPPVPIPPLDVCMYWSQGHAQDHAHQWFRESLSAAAETKHAL